MSNNIFIEVLPPIILTKAVCSLNSFTNSLVCVSLSGERGVGVEGGGGEEEKG